MQTTPRNQDALLTIAEAVAQINTSIRQGGESDYEDDSYLGHKHESVLLDHGAKYGYTNDILHLRDKDGVLWQISENHDNGGFYNFYRFNDEAFTTTAFGPMRYSEFLGRFQR